MSLYSVKRIFYIFLSFCLLYVGYLSYNIHYNIKLWYSRQDVLTNSYKLIFNDQLKETSIHGFLNVHSWPLACHSKLENLREHALFPIAPQLQRLVNTLGIHDHWRLKNDTFNAKYFANRIFGFIQVPVTGNYKWSLAADGDAELWLSKDKQNVQLLLQVNNSVERDKTHNFSHNISSVSPEILLEKDTFYFIDILQIYKRGNDQLLVTWKPPGSLKFKEINTTYLFSFTGEHSNLKKLTQSMSLAQNAWKKYSMESILGNTKFLKNYSKYLDFSAVSLALNTCTYKPGYVGKPVSYQYKTIHAYVNPTFVYPEVKHAKLKDGKWIPWFPLDEKDAVSVTQKYMKYLELAYPGKYQLRNILNVERKTNWLKIPKYYNGTMKDGDRYLLELQLWDEEKKDNVVLSEFVYKHFKKDILCYPEGVHWNIKTPVFLLISVRKQEPWIRHLIKNLEQIYLDTKDENVHLVIYDYNTTDFDIEEELERSVFNNYQVLRVSDGKYSRTYSLNRAAEAVSNPHAIIFTLDLHLNIPSTFPNNLRKHCIEGKMVYTPIISRLSCGATPDNPSGSWDPWGYGMFGAYKSDWDRFHGFNEERFKTRWGGEDWDLVDRAYKVGLEFERIKHADFYHYYHTRQGMW